MSWGRKREQERALGGEREGRETERERNKSMNIYIVTGTPFSKSGTAIGNNTNGNNMISLQFLCIYLSLP